MVFSIFTELCKHHHNLILGLSRRANWYPSAVTPRTLCSSPRTTTLVSMDLPTLHTSYKWNHTACGLLWCSHLASCCSMYQYFILFHGWRLFHYMDVFLLAHPFTDGHLACFRFSAMRKTTATTIPGQVFVMDMFSFLLAIYWGGEFRSQMVTLSSTFQGAVQLFLKWLNHFTLPPAMYDSFISLYLHQRFFPICLRL